MYLWLFFTINNINLLRLCVIWHKYSLFFTNHTFHFPDLMSLMIYENNRVLAYPDAHAVVCRNLQIRTNAYCRHVNAFYGFENPSESSIAQKNKFFLLWIIVYQSILEKLVFIASIFRLLQPHLLFYDSCPRFLLNSHISFFFHL